MNPRLAKVAVINAQSDGLFDQLVFAIEKYIREKRASLIIDWAAVQKRWARLDRPQDNIFLNSGDLGIQPDAGLDRAVKYLKFLMEGGYTEKELFNIVFHHCRQAPRQGMNGPLAGSSMLRLSLLEILSKYLCDKVGISRLRLQSMVRVERESYGLAAASSFGAISPPSDADLLSVIISRLIDHCRMKSKVIENDPIQQSRYAFFQPVDIATRLIKDDLIKQRDRDQFDRVKFEL